MTGLMTWLEGKKTYIVMILGFVFNIGVVAGWWTVENQVWDLINLILGFLGIGAIRSSLKSEANKLASK